MGNSTLMNGEAKQISLSIQDRIFLGEGLFETLRVSQSKPCNALDHWQRLKQSAERLGLTFTLSNEDWQGLLEHHIHKSNLEEGGIKVILTGGQAERGLTAQGRDNQFIVDTFDHIRGHKPLRLMTAPWLRDAENPIYQLKTCNYLEAILARKKAVENGFDDVLFINQFHRITETSCANVFIIKNNTLYTPLVSEGVLAGITRGRILNFCSDHGIACHEALITLDDFREADAAFTCNALQGIQAVIDWDARSFNPEQRLLKRLMFEI